MRWQDEAVEAVGGQVVVVGRAVVGGIQQGTCVPCVCLSRASCRVRAQSGCAASSSYLNLHKSACPHTRTLRQPARPRTHDPTSYTHSYSRSLALAPAPAALAHTLASRCGCERSLSGRAFGRV